MNQATLFPPAAPPAVTVPKHRTGERFAIQLFTVEGTSLGPYVGLPLQSLWTPYSGHLFTRNTAEQIVKDLHTCDAVGCGLTAAFADDGTLTFTWTEDYDEEGGAKAIIPDRWGRYEIGGLWVWDDWHDGTPQSEEQGAFARGACEYRQTDESWSLPADLRAPYTRGREEAHRVTLHMDDTPERALHAALAEYGIAAYAADDAGNSWLEIPLNQDRDYFTDPGPYLLVDVQLEGDDWVFVDEAVGTRRAHWRVHLSMGGGTPRETHLLTVPADETERVAAFIADLLITP